MQSITVDLIPGGKMPTLNASQYDVKRAFHINLTENRQPYALDGTETLKFSLRKGDNCLVTMDIENTFATQKYIEFATTEQMTAFAGCANFGEIRIVKGDTDIGTLNFWLNVEPSPEEGGVRSDSEINNLARQVNELVDDEMGNYYDKTEADDKFATNTDLQTLSGVVNTKASQTDLTALVGVVNGKANTTDVNNALANKMNKANPTGSGSFSLNRKSGSTVGQYSHAEGYNCEASGQGSHAEGLSTKSTGYQASHAEGAATNASGTLSHAEGFGSTASGEASHAEGSSTIASGECSHAEGKNTEARGECQHVFGKYNIIDGNNEFIEIVGNGPVGIWNERSNARTLDWDGNETLAGDLTYNGNKSLTSEISRLDGKIDNLPVPMIFKGTLGVGGTIQALPAASASNEGFTYKVITDGTYAGQTAKVGDVFTSNGSAWVYIPSGDEDNDTWRNIKVNGTEVLGNGISSGAVDFEDTANVKFEFDANGNKVRAKLDGIYTDNEVDDLLDDKADADNTYTKEQVDDIVYGILPDDTASGSVANFTTSLELPIKSLDVDVNAVQESSTPTPSSPKAISGWNAITLDVNGTTEVINLGGTYYGGHFTQDKDGHRQYEVDRKLKTVDGSAGVTVASSSYIKSDACDGYINDDEIQPRVSAEYQPDLLCNRLTQAKGNIWSNVGHADEFCINNRSIHFNISNTALGIVDYTQETTETVKAKIDAFLQNNPVVVVIPITPYVIDLPDGEPIFTLNGTNNIYADTGDTDVVFKCSVNDYINAHQSSGAKSLGSVFLGSSNSGSEEEPTGESEEPKEELKEVTKTLGDEPISKK